MADIVCQVINRDRDDRIEFIWSAGGGFFDSYIVRGTELAELRTTADHVRDGLETLVVTLNRTQGQMEAIPCELSYGLAEAGFRLFNDLLPPEDSTAKVVRRWLEGFMFRAVSSRSRSWSRKTRPGRAVPGDPLEPRIRPGPSLYKDAFQKGQGVERWRPFWAIRYNLTSGRRVDPWRRLSDWTDPRVVAVIDPKAREGLRAEERRDLDVFLKEFGSSRSPHLHHRARRTPRRCHRGWLTGRVGSGPGGRLSAPPVLARPCPAGLPLARRRAYLPG